MAAVGSRNIPRVWTEFGTTSRQPWLMIPEMSWLYPPLLENGASPPKPPKKVLLHESK